MRPWLLLSLAGALAGRAAAADLDALRARVVEVEAAGGVESPDLIPALIALGEGYAEVDDEEALAVYQRVHRLRQESLGSAHPDVVASIVELARIHLGFGRVPEARELAIRAVAVARPAGGLPLADALDALGKVESARADLPAAEAAFTETLALRRDAYGPTHEQVSIALNNLGAIAVRRGDLAGARARLEEGLAVRDRLGLVDENTASLLNNLASMYTRSGDHDEAERLLARSLALKEEIYGPGDVKVATALNNLAGVYKSRGQPRRAIPLFERAIAIIEAARGPDDPLVADATLNLGNVWIGLGDYARADALCRRALALFEARGGDHPDTAKAVNGIALIRKLQGDLLTARALFERSLAMREKALGPTHPDLATALTNLGSLLEEIGDFAAARRCYERAISVVTLAFGEEHAETAAARLYLAGLEAATARPEARSTFEASIAVLVRTLGEGHPKVAGARHDLGLAMLDAGEPVAAVEVLEQAVAASVAHLGEGHPSVAMERPQLGYARVAAGDLARGRAELRAGLEAWELRVGPDHPRTPGVLDRLATAEAAAGDLDAARTVSDRSLAMRESKLDLLDGLSEREALAASARSRKTLHLWLGLHDRPEDALVAWSAVLRWKGVATRRIHARTERARLGDDPEVHETWVALSDTRRDLARLALAETDEVSGPERIEALTLRKEELERALAEHGVGDPPPSVAGPAEVCAALGPDTALVDTVRLADRYLAFVVSGPRCAVTRVDLGDAAGIDDALFAWRAVLARRALDARERPRARVVGDLVWEPLVAALGDARSVVVVPDGRLSTLPFAALPVGDDYLVEHRGVTYLESALDLVDPAPVSAAGLLGVADVSYGDAVGAATRACEGEGYPPLPGTRTELDAVLARWSRGPFRREPVDALTGPEADESRVATSLTGHRVVHLASHGYFATDRCALVDPAAAGLNPMLLSGVVVAGANAPRDPLAAEDGVLTAEELATLDLRGTELVVLSACETGLGEVRSGEGVLGLRRALVGAGARTVVMSLWAVQDGSTSDLMAGFYQRLLSRRSPASPGDALRGAQLAMLARHRALDGEGDPASWAGFVVSGASATGRPGGMRVTP